MTDIEIGILEIIRNNISNKILDTIMIIITSLGNYSILWIALTIILIVVPKTRRLGLNVLISLVIKLTLCNLILKPIIARPRPFNLNTSVKLLINKTKDYSFPSGHTASAFAVASTFLFNKNKYWKTLIIIAILISISRLYLYVHYPTDVLGGIIIGMLSGYVGTIISNKIRTLSDNK